MERLKALARPATGAQLVAQLGFVALVVLAIGWQTLDQPTTPDFAIFWAAQRTPTPYDTTEFVRLLGSGIRHFPYLPPFLLLTWPLKWMSYPVAYLTWGVTSFAAVMLAVRRVGAPLLLLCPAVFMASLNGQTSLLMGAALFAAASLDKRPIVVGLLYGLVACVKPQVGVLIPVLLVASGQWRTIAVAALTVVVVVALTLCAYGPDLWRQWAASLPSYVADDATAFSGRYLSLPGAWKAAALAAGAVAVWISGRRGDLICGAFAAVAAALLGSVHAVDYDLAIVAPFAFTLALRIDRLSPALVIGLLLPPSAAVMGLLGLTALVRSTPTNGFRLGRKPARQSAWQEPLQQELRDRA